MCAAAAVVAVAAAAVVGVGVSVRLQEGVLTKVATVAHVNLHYMCSIPSRAHPSRLRLQLRRKRRAKERGGKSF